MVSPGLADHGQVAYTASLCDLQAPVPAAVPTAAQVQVGPRLSPKQVIHFYEPGEWEEFVLEWAEGFVGTYHQVKRIGGANDKGADIAAFVTPSGFEGDWDCFQCKHYRDPLAPTDAWPEIFKVLRSVRDRHYTLPREYRFVAPRGCGPTLSRLLSSPAKLKSKFLAILGDAKSPLLSLADRSELDSIAQFAAAVDFAIFKSYELHELVADHRRTSHHARRFGGGLPPRPPSDSPPADPQPIEARYVQQLTQVYAEYYTGAPSTLVEVQSHKQASEHLARQRVAFYSAEALRAFARDCVPAGTFEHLQDEMYDGVIEIHDAEHYNGMARLRAVLDASASVAVTSNALAPEVRVRDRKGICHQLANGDRLQWRSP